MKDIDGISNAITTFVGRWSVLLWLVLFWTRVFGVHHLNWFITIGAIVIIPLALYSIVWIAVGFLLALIYVLEENRRMK